MATVFDFVEGNEMPKAVDIANFMVYLMTDSYDDVTNMKLNKLLYYAQGHYLKKYGKPLFEEKILAWKHGPVIREVYEEYKRVEDKPINRYDTNRAKVMDSDIKAFILDIAGEYGKYTASALRNMTHKPKSPWAVTENNAEIKREIIKEYFDKNEKEIEPFMIEYTDDDFIGYRDNDGVLVLPEEWNDEAI